MVSKEAQEKISRLQLLEQNLQNLVAQRQQFQAQLLEIESALRELAPAPETYKIIGNLMVKAKPEDLTKDLGQRKELVDLRMKTFEKQENQLKEKAESLRKEVLAIMNTKQA